MFTVVIYVVVILLQIYKRNKKEKKKEVVKKVYDHTSVNHYRTGNTNHSNSIQPN